MAIAFLLYSPLNSVPFTIPLTFEWMVCFFTKNMGAITLEIPLPLSTTPATLLAPRHTVALVTGRRALPPTYGSPPSCSLDPISSNHPPSPIASSSLFTLFHIILKHAPSLPFWKFLPSTLVIPLATSLLCFKTKSFRVLSMLTVSASSCLRCLVYLGPGFSFQL